MINGDVTEFVDQIYTGMDLYFLYKNQKFLLEGITIEYPEEGDPIGQKVLKNVQNLLRLEPVLRRPYWMHVFPEGVGFPAEEFLKAKIFDGKTFWEVQEEIEWIDC